MCEIERERENEVERERERETERYCVREREKVRGGHLEVASERKRQRDCGGGRERNCT